jgi:hypothetical protein
VTEFEIRCEFEALRGCDITISRKYHVRYWSSRKSDATDQLAYKVDAALLIGNGHYYPNRYEKGGTNAEC